jgi:hypothetical protein
LEISLVRGPVFEDAETKMGEFSHGGAQGGHCVFAAFEQRIVHRLDVRVVSPGRDGRPIEGGPYLGGAVPGQAGRPEAQRRGLTPAGDGEGVKRVIFGEEA